MRLVALMQPEGQPLRPLSSHGDACFGCGAKHPAGLRMRFVDDGMVTRAALTLDSDWASGGEIRASVILAAMEEALLQAAHARLGTDAMTDGKIELFIRDIKPGLPFVVEAWPGRRSGMGFFFYARVVQGGVECGHAETWMATKVEALARRAATTE